MGKYRSWEERRAIIRAIIASSSPPPLSSFHLSESEKIYFRARAERAVNKLARQTSNFKAYYKLPTKWPFGYVVSIAILVFVISISAIIYLYLYYRTDSTMYPLAAASVTLGTVAVGWVIGGWTTYRNTIRQNTNNLLFARFSQTPFGEAMHRFHRTFGSDPMVPVTSEALAKLRKKPDEESRKAVASVAYLLNYYEFVAAGVLHGDFDAEIVTANIRGVIIFYHDMCEPHIQQLNRENPKTFEHLIKIRTHYREP